jgi:CBS domain-containing protein
MMKHRINHICITNDGTPNTEVTGILSEHDIRVSEGHNPSVLIKAIKRSGSTKELKKIRHKIVLLLKGYIDQNIPLTHISRIIFELNDATIKRVVERCIEKMAGPPPINFAWLSLGSQGRKEQLLHTDQDNAIVFENVPEEKLENTREYFLQLATKINKRLNIIGYEFCPADVMAKNSNWCLSLTEWKQKFTVWIKEPGADELLLCSIFFDYDISYGDVELSNSLSDHIFKLTESNRRFLTNLGSSAIRNPSPLGFFRNFLVEQDGEKKDHFDLKKRGILPITDAGRLLAIEHQIKNINNTAERFERLAELEPRNKELFLACSYASKSLLKFRTKSGLLSRDSGRFIKLDSLSKEEKIKLKRSFKTIKEVQDLIKVRYETTSIL